MFNSLIFNNNDSSDLVTQEYLTRQHYTNKNYVDAADVIINNTLTGYATTFATNNLVSTSATLNVGCSPATSTMNLACGTGVQTVNVGLNNGVTQINLGGPLDTVVLAGALVTNNSTVNNIVDKVMTMNKGGAANSLSLSGLLFEENGIITGYIQIGASRDKYLLKIPSSGTVITLDQSLGSTDDVNFNNLALNSMTVSGNSIFGNATINGDLNANGIIKFDGVKSIDCGTNNTLVGKNAGTATMGSYQTGIGTNTLSNATATSWGNSAVGYGCLAGNTDGIYNTSCGMNSMLLNTTGNNNAAIGYLAGGINVSGSNGTYIGFNAQPLTSSLINATAIGAGSIVTANDTMQLGNSNLALINTNASLLCNQITAGNTAITGTLSATGNLSIISNTFNLGNNRQPVTVNSTFSNVSTITIPTLFQSGATVAEIKFRFMTTQNAVNVLINGMTDLGAQVSGTQASESSKIYNQAESFTNNGYLAPSVGSTTMNMSTITLTKKGTGNNGNWLHANSTFTWANVGNAKSEIFQFIDNASIVGLVVFPSASTISGSYSVTNFF